MNWKRIAAREFLLLVGVAVVVGLVMLGAWVWVSSESQQVAKGLVQEEIHVLRAQERAAERVFHSSPSHDTWRRERGIGQELRAKEVVLRQMEERWKAAGWWTAIALLLLLYPLRFMVLGAVWSVRVLRAPASAPTPPLE